MSATAFAHTSRVSLFHDVVRRVLLSAFPLQREHLAGQRHRSVLAEQGSRPKRIKMFTDDFLTYNRSALRCASPFLALACNARLFLNASHRLPFRTLAQEAQLHDLKQEADELEAELRALSEQVHAHDASDPLLCSVSAPGAPSPAAHPLLPSSSFHTFRQRSR